MAITAAMVKELREVSGAGMMDCKKALNETDGDMDAAIEFLRKNGEAIELDFEIMVPIDKDIPLTLEFCMCDKFYIEEVLDIHVVTSKFSFEKEMTEINQYIRENNILPKTATYSFLEKDDNEMIDTHIIFGI